MGSFELALRSVPFTSAFILIIFLLPNVNAGGSAEAGDRPSRSRASLHFGDFNSTEHISFGALSRTTLLSNCTNGNSIYFPFGTMIDKEESGCQQCAEDAIRACAPGRVETVRCTLPPDFSCSFTCYGNEVD